MRPCALTLAGLLLAGTAAAQAAAIRLKSAQSTVLIGSPFEIAGEAELAPGDALRSPASDASKGEFEILSIDFGKPRSEGGKTILPILLRASAFALGEQTLPALPWTMVRADGTTGTAQSNPVSVTVAPPKPSGEESGELRDIQGPYAPPVWPWYLLAALFLLALGAGVTHLLRKRRKEPPSMIREPGDTRTYEEIALADIDSLPDLGLSAKEFYDRLSDIVRLYLQRRCGIPALQMTSYDLIRGMLRAELPSDARTKMKSLLASCDLAKFARHQPAQREYVTDCSVAKEIVCMLSPIKRDADHVRDLAAVLPAERAS